MNENQLDPNSLEQNIPDTASDPGNPLPSPLVSTPALFSDKKNKPIDYPGPRKAAAINLLHNSLPEPTSYEQFMQQNEAQLRQNPLYGTGSQTPGVYLDKIVRKYDDQDFGFIPNTDLDDFYGKRESWLETTGKGLARVPLYTGLKVAEGVGYSLGLISPWNYFGDEGVISNAANNALAQWASEATEEVRTEWLPTFQEAADREKGFWNRAFTDGDFWAEDFVDGAAFALSAFVPGMALSKLGLGARAMSALGKFRYGVGTAEAAIEGAASIGNYFDKAQKWGQRLDKFNTWALATASESMFEAKEVRDRVRESLREKGTYSEAEINKIAGSAARDSFVMNSALLGMTNLFSYKYMAKMFGMGDKTLAKGAITPGMTLADEAILKPAESLRSMYFKGVAGSIAREGYIEENLQLAIQRINEEYGMKGQIGSFMEFFGKSGDVLGQYVKQTKESITESTPEARETATNIGLGGLIGAGQSLLTEKGIRNDKQRTAENILAGFTGAQNSWLKYGDIFKTEQVETGKDEAGNPVFKTRTVIDESGQPVVDDAKIAAIATGLEANAAMLSDAEKVQNRKIAEYLRQTAFAEFTLAHVNAGIQDSLLKKLEDVRTASPEDMAKLGFVADDTLNDQITKYKSIAADIIKQSELIDNSILNDNSKEDQYRIASLKRLAALQVISKVQASQIQNELDEFKNEMIGQNPEMTALSDGLVDQLNELQMRIDLQQKTIAEVQKQGTDKDVSLKLYNQQLKDLQDAYKKLEKENELTVSTLTKDENGYYNYEKAERNNILFRMRLDNKRKEKASFLNDVKNRGMEWAYYADNKDGKKNFKAVFDKIVAAQEELRAKRKEQEEKPAEQEQPQPAAETEGQPPVAEQPGQQAAAQTEDQPGEQQQEQEDSGLDAYLRDKYDNLAQIPGFNTSFEDWVKGKDGQYWTKQYNANKPKKSAEKPEPSEEENALAGEIAGLNLAETKIGQGFQKAVDAIKDLIAKIAGNKNLMDQLLAKINQVVDETAKDALLKLIVGPATRAGSEGSASGYVPLIDKGLDTKTKNHIGFDKINLNFDESSTGFIIKGEKALLDALSADNTTRDINDRVRIVASKKYVRFEQEKVAGLGIPNRTMITFETPNEVTRLKKGEPVIAVASRSTGFSTQVRLKESASDSESRIVGIENYAIVYPDNTTELITFSEQQREFVKKNMLFAGKEMTDADYNRLQTIYNQLQLFNQEVENLMGDNQEMDITPIFQKYFNLGFNGRRAEKGQTLEELYNSNPGQLFEVRVETEDGRIVSRQAGLIARKFGNTWELFFDLPSGDVLVSQDPETGEFVSVQDKMEYLRNEHGINLNLTDGLGGVNFWIAKVSPQESNDRGYKPYALKVSRAKNLEKSFRNFALALSDVRKAITAGQEKNVFTFDGKDYNDINQLLKKFNIDYFGFNQSLGWIVNFSFNPKTEKFALELRPADRDKRNKLTPAQKQALNLYFSDKALAGLTKDSSDQEVIAAYTEWVDEIKSGFAKLAEKMEKSEDSTIRDFRNSLQNPVLIEYQEEDGQKTDYIKLVDRVAYKNNPFPNLVYNAREIKAKLTVGLHEAPVSPSTQKPADKPQNLRTVVDLSGKEFDDEEDSSPNLPTGTQPSEAPSRGITTIINLDDEDAPFMLREEEDYKKYTELTYQEEIQWLAKALPSDIKLRDLGTIIDNLAAGKQILGYYKNRALYVSQNLSAEGTIYHEAFHGLFRDIFTSDQRQFYIARALSKMGNITRKEIEDFRSERGYTNKSDAQIVDLMAEEYLADGFRKFKLDKKEPADGWFKRFVKLLDRIISFFKRNSDAIDQLYEDFDSGKFGASEVRTAGSISNEGVFALAYGRPKLVETVAADGARAFGRYNSVPLKQSIQNELVNKLVYRISQFTQGTFEDKFNRAVSVVREDYNLNQLLEDKDEPTRQAIINRFQDDFNEALFVLGSEVPYSLDELLAQDAEAAALKTEAGANRQSLDIIKKEVKTKVENLGIETGFSAEDYRIPQSDEDLEIANKSEDFDKVSLNPLEGLSREFRSLFSLIPYQQNYPELGISLTKMADGNKLFNAMMKIASNKPLDMILPTLAQVADRAVEDNDPDAVVLDAFANFISDKFGIPRDQLANPQAGAERNIFLFKQFMDTFFTTELPGKVVKVTVNEESVKAEIFDAGINQDQVNKKEAIAFYYNRGFRRLKTEEDKKKFNEDFKKLQDFITTSLLPYLETRSLNRREDLNRMVDRLKEMMDNVNIVLPKSLLRQSFLAIYNLENKKEFNPNSKKNIWDMQYDQALMKEGAYLQKDFFNALSQISQDNYEYLFADTRMENVNVGKDKRSVDQLNKILKKAAKYIIKYDVGATASVYQNANDEKVYRYSRYTPPILLAQIVREQGISAITDMYPELRAFMEDNPLFDGSVKNQLFLQSLNVSAFGGVRHVKEGVSDEGVTFGDIDPRALLVSNIVFFMNRSTISARMKNEKGANEDVTITTFERSRTQEEGTTSNFLVTGNYEKYTSGNKPNKAYLNKTVDMLRQEYNRIQREWASRTDMSARRFAGYNDNLHPETGQPLLDDSYTLQDGKRVVLRAYQFKNFEHFFDQHFNPDTADVRRNLKDNLRESAKQGKSFELAMQDPYVKDNLVQQLGQYAEDTFKTYLESLKNFGVVKESTSLKEDTSVTTLTSEFLPSTIKEDFADPRTLDKAGYSGLEEMLMDHHLNVEINKRMVNQIFDGDIATGIKNTTEYYKRNKSGVISGNSHKNYHVRTAVVKKIQADVNKEDLTELAKDITPDTANDRKVDIADGQSYHTINHRIRLEDSWGRVDNEVKTILNASKYRRLTSKEIRTLEEKRVSLVSKKTATGGVFEYHKLSEHLLIRPDISHLVIPPGKTREDVHNELDELYTQIEYLEDGIVLDPNREDAASIEDQISELYAKVHRYWYPKRGREELHYMLNSMELDGVDQLFDTNASKKTTLVPVSLVSDRMTSLKPSKSFTSGMFKFMQVETSGIKKRITLPSQPRQLLTTYINKLANDKVYRNKTLQELAQEYSEVLGAISQSSLNTMNMVLRNDMGKMNVTQLFETMYENLKKQGADSNTLKYFEVRDGKPVHNPNLPVIKQQFTYYFFSLFNEGIFSKEVSGRSDIHVSSYGYKLLIDTQDDNRIITQEEQDRNPELYQDPVRYQTRYPGVSVERVDGRNIYTVEVIIPRHLVRNQEERELLETRLNRFFSSRTPAEDKRSLLVAKVVDYIDGSYRNSIIVPQLIHILAGSDLDIDKLYSHTFDYYFDFNNVPHVYGDYSKYATEKQGRFAEYIMYMGKHPYLKDLVDKETERVVQNPRFSSDFMKVADELGLTEIPVSAEDLQTRRLYIMLDLEELQKAKKRLQEEHDVYFNEYVSFGKTSQQREKWAEKRAEYLIAKNNLESAEQELENISDELERIDNTFRMAALVNVLKAKKMPVTMAGLTQYLRDNPTPVIPALDNLSLQQKIDILSNERVFKDFYIKEQSSTEEFKKLAASIGESVDTVFAANSIYTIMGDVMANNINSSGKGGIGVEASFNKFLAFAEKNSLELEFDLMYDISEEGQKRVHSNFMNTNAIRQTGQALGMFADAAKDPIPSVLNLNPDTVGNSNIVLGMTGNLQLSVLLNKVPAIEEIVKEYQKDKSAISGGGFNQQKSLASRFMSEFFGIRGELDKQKRLAELYEVDKDNKVTAALRKMYFTTTAPDVSQTGLAKLGIQLVYEDNRPVAEDVAMGYIYNLLHKINRVNQDVLKLGKILNLIKNQNPDFTELDQTLENVDYFLSGKSTFGKSIATVLKNSREYRPLIEAARTMSDYSKQVLIERSPLFASINNILFAGLSNRFGNARASSRITDQISKFIIINKVKSDMLAEIKELKGKTDKKSVKRLALLENSIRYFKSDFWLKENSLQKDLDYLYEKNPGNSFVEFLKINTRNGIDYLESGSRMKLDNNLTEEIINGFEALQKSKDPETERLAGQMFYYLLAKDGLGYGAFTFVKYLNPDMSMFSSASRAMDQFLDLLIKQEDFIKSQDTKIRQIRESGLKEEDKKARIKEITKKVYDNYTALFDQYFNNTGERAGKIDWINGIVTKIFSYVGNQQYIRQNYSVKVDSKEKREVLKSMIDAGVYSHLESGKALKDKYFNYLSGAENSFIVDFTKIADKSDVVTQADQMFRSNDFIMNDEGTLVSASFQFLISDRSGNVFKLSSVDGVDVTEFITLGAVSLETGDRSSQFTAMSGMKAEYTRVTPEGTEQILNFGFTPQDAKALYEASRKVTSEQDRVSKFLERATLKNNSENKAAFPLPSQTQGFDLSDAAEEGEELTDEAFEAALAAGRFKYVKPSAAAQPQAGQSAAESGEITLKEIDEIYNAKSTKSVTLPEFRQIAQDLIKVLKAAGKTKSDILQTVKCL